MKSFKINWIVRSPIYVDIDFPKGHRVIFRWPIMWEVVERLIYLPGGGESINYHRTRADAIKYVEGRKRGITYFGGHEDDFSYRTVH